MGVEYNFRIGFFDFKFFFNGRFGIVVWILINLLFVVKQYEDFGYVSNFMIIFNILYGIYVVDFFFNEFWYLCIIDMVYDYFGFYLVWGDICWLFFMYIF